MEHALHEKMGFQERWLIVAETRSVWQQKTMNKHLDTCIVYTIHACTDIHTRYNHYTDGTAVSQAPDIVYHATVYSSQGMS